MANTGPKLIEYEKYVHIAKRVKLSVDHGTMVPFERDKLLLLGQGISPLSSM